ncbi:hypothetical protein AM588_10010876 [Phytophthora nicotianae]|uniref:Uncharacterized protein n=1 Tax=Phytophthora nicotianae TaxID=4792 RepID=A0A0W8DPJ8_PHYNI|nr:hypothetical protein AM588_10010876 [Phytophthora nicotianae]
MRAICVPSRVRLSTLRCCAHLHVGRATGPATEDFVVRSPFQPSTAPKLRVSEAGTDAQWVSVAPRGIGSPDLWAKDMPRVDISKTLTSSYTSNFIQAAVNPSVVTRAGEKQAYVEALALNEAVEDLDIPRECFVVSTLIGSNVVHPTNPDADDRLTQEYVEKGVEITMNELDVETLDHVFRKEREMLLIGDRPLETMLSSGNPFHLTTYNDMVGEDVALLLKTAFNLAIAVEKKYVEKIRPDKEHLDLPPPEDVAWGHILANQHSQFDNLQVWRYVRETQIFPRLDATIKEFNKHKETEELGFAYSMAMNQLLKCFTGSVELVDADRASNIMSAWKEKGLLVSDNMSIQEVAVMATLSSGIDITLLEEQLPASSSLPFTHRFSPDQLQQIVALTRPHLTVEK